MDMKEIAEELVAGCREGRVMENLDKLYATDAVSLEAMAGDGDLPREIVGRDAIRGKHEWWYANHEVHSSEIEGPFPHGDDRFAVFFVYDITDKVRGQRIAAREIGVYHVADGKIVREEFFYGM